MKKICCICCALAVALTSFVLMSSVSVRAANEFENAEIGYGELIDSFIETVNPDEVNYLEIINKTDYENFIEYLQDNQASYDLNANSMNYSADFNDEKHLNALLIDAMNAGYVTNYYGDISLFWAGGNNSSGTHYRLGDRIITILQNDGRTDAYSFLNSNKEQFLLGTYEPDINESAPATHYYVTGKPQKTYYYYPNREGDYNISARTRFEEHYSMAVQFYSVSPALAARSLGRAMHYFMDMTATPHAAGIRANSPVEDWLHIRDTHAEYETFGNSILEDNYILFSDKYSFVYQNSFSTVFNNIVDLMGCEMYADLTRHSNSSNPEYVSMVEMGLYLAQEYGTAIINRFMYDVNAASSFPKLQNNGIYCIRNYSGLYMDVDDMLTAEGTHLSTYFYHGQINQRFKVVFNTVGSNLLTINIVPMLSLEKFVSAVDDATGFDMSINLPQVSDNIYQEYRITFMPLLNGGARINLNAECKKVISVRDRSSGQNRLNVDDFDPERTDQQWFFELYS